MRLLHPFWTVCFLIGLASFIGGCTATFQYAPPVGFSVTVQPLTPPAAKSVPRAVAP